MLNIKTVLLTTVALAAAGIAYAAPKADLNQDGQVTQTEFMSAATTRFVTADTNADGVLTDDEMKAARKSQRDEHAARRFEKLDVNGDGVISKSEYDAKRAEIGEKMKERRDVNGDGVVDAADREAHKAERAARKAERDANGEARPDRAEGERKMRGPKGKRGGMRGPNPDANGDGVVTRAEYEASTLAMFAKLDANGDGVLTKGEGGKRGKRGGPRGGGPR